MIHTYNTSKQYVRAENHDFRSIHDYAMKKAVEFFKPEYPESSIEIYISVSEDSTSAFMEAYINIAYDTAKDKNVSKTITGGRSIPVPSH